MNIEKRSPGSATIRNLLMVIAAMLLVAIVGVAPVVRADESKTVASGTFDSGGTWTLDSEGVLTLSGNVAYNGDRPSSSTSWPWYSKRKEIKSVVSNDVIISGTNYSYMFSDCTNLTSLIGLDKWGTSKVTQISSMFSNCSSLTRIDISDWDASSVTNAHSIFYGCESLEYAGLPVINNDRIQVNDIFSKCLSLTSGAFGPTGKWSISDNGTLTLSGNIDFIPNISDSSTWPWFYQLKKVKTLVISPETSICNSAAYMFAGMTKLEEITGLENLDVSSAMSLDHMFYYCLNISDLSGVKGWDVSNAKSMNYMFAYCQKNQKSTSNELIAGWEMSPSATTEDMFLGWAESQSLKVSKLKVDLENKSKFVLDEDGNYTYTPQIAAYMATNDCHLEPSYSVSFSLSSEADHAAGSVEIRIPANLFKNKLGSYVYTTAESAYAKSFSYGMTRVDFSIPKAPSISNSTPFNYSYDATTDEYVIKNTESLPAATEMAFTFPYYSGWSVWTMKNGEKTDDFYATLIIKDSNNDTTIVTETAPGIVPITTAKYSTTSNSRLSGFSASLTYPTNWSDKFKPSDGDYLYVVYMSNTAVWATQSWTQTTTAAPDNNGTVLAYATASGQYEYQRNKTTENASCAINQGSLEAITFILVAYPVTDSIKDGAKHTFSLTSSHVLNGSDGAHDEMQLKATYNYEYQPFKVYNNYGSVNKGVYENSNLVFPTNGVGRPEAKADYGILSAIKNNLSAFQKNTSFVLHFYSQTYKATFNDDGTEDAETNPDNYGVNPVTSYYIDDAMFLDDDYEHQLTSEDYEISYVDFSDIYLYEYSEGNYGWSPNRVSLRNYTGDAKIFMYGKTDDGEWEKIGQLGKITLYSQKDGSLLQGKGYTGIKFETTNTLYQTEIYASVRITLKPSKYVMSKINDKSIEQHFIKNFATAVTYDHDGNMILGTGQYTGPGAEVIAELDKAAFGTTVAHSVGILNLADIKEEVDFDKSLVSSTIDADNQRFKINYSVILSEGADLPSEDEEVMKELHPLKGTFYDLLPLGCTVDERSVTVSTTYYASGKIDNVEINTIDNYNDTGRTLLVVQVNEPGSYTASSLWAKDYYRLTYTIYYSFESLQDFGVDLHNSAVFKYDGDSWLEDGMKTSLGTAAADDSEIDLALLLGDTAKKKIFVADSLDVKLSVGSAADLSLSKAVKDTDNTTYSQGHDGNVIVSEYESYSYRLRFGSESDTTTSNIILFDSIENYVLEDGTTSGWRGTLENIDLTQPKLKGIAPIVYYSTIAGLNIDKNHDITDTAVWTKAEDTTDLSKVTAIAIDMRKDKDGNDYELPEKQTIRVTLNMKAPSGDEYTKAARKKLRAYNNVYLMNNLTTSTSHQSDHFIHYDYTEVRLEEPDILPVSVALSAKKVLEDAGLSGMTLAENEFSFNLKDSSGTLLQTKANAADGTVAFDEIEYVEEGTYTYVIEEVLPSGGTYSEDRKKYVKDNITYDLNPITVSVVVTVNDNNELVATKQ